MALKNLSGEKRFNYSPELDSIRGLAFVAVFFFHTLPIVETHTWLNDFIIYLQGNLLMGLDVFFVLSAFLLTCIGLTEYKRTGGFSIKRYFARRILRIWPLYFFILFLAFILFPIIALIVGTSMTLPNPWYYVFFISNFYLADHVFFLRFLWTISVEEQFYFLLGISMKYLTGHVRWLIGAFILISVTFALCRIWNNEPFYFNTLFYLIDFSLGSVAGILYINRNTFVTRWIEKMNAVRTVGFYAFLPLQFFFFFILIRATGGVISDLVALLGRYVFVSYIALLLLEQLLNPLRCRLLGKNRAIIFTGKISYGLYCYHGITITFGNMFADKYFTTLPYWILVLLIFIVNYIVSTLSYFYYELPFLKLKSKFR